MPVFVKVSQNKNEQSKAFGKYYGRVVSTKTMSYQELCKHMSEHNSVFGEDVCLGVANKLQNCILEQLLEGKKVQFGELGTFYLSSKSVKLGQTMSTPLQDVVSLHCKREAPATLNFFIFNFSLFYF